MLCKDVCHMKLSKKQFIFRNISQTTAISSDYIRAITDSHRFTSIGLNLFIFYAKNNRNIILCKFKHITCSHMLRGDWRLPLCSRRF